MIGLVLSGSATESAWCKEAATLFSRNFPVHSGIPLIAAQSESRPPVGLVYGDCSPSSLARYAGDHRALIALPAVEPEEGPVAEDPIDERSYQSAGVEVPVFGSCRSPAVEGFTPFIQMSDGEPLALEGEIEGVPVVQFRVDLIGESSRLLTGHFDRDTGSDQHGRHNPPPQRIYGTPSVSFYYNLIGGITRRLYARIERPLLSIRRWPGAAPMALFLSHDVDAVRKWTWQRVLYELGRALVAPRTLKPTIASLMEAARGRDPYWNFDELLWLEAEYGFSSTWFFAPFGDAYARRLRSIDPVYHRPPSQLISALGRIREQGCEIGLHAIRDAYLDEGELRAQLSALEGQTGIELQGIRYHYLMFHHGKTWQAVCRAGLRYDASRGFSDRVGFRDGVATPFFPFARSGGDLVEVPLHAMDGVFLHAEGDEERVRREIFAAYGLARIVGGMFSFLLHPGCLDSLEIPALESCYRSLLAQARRDRCRAMTGRQLCDWWLSRERVLGNMECGSGGWRIEGTAVPKEMVFAVSTSSDNARKVEVQGASAARSQENGDLLLQLERVDPEQGVTFVVG